MEFRRTTTPFSITSLHPDEEESIAQIAAFMPDTFREMAPDFVPNTKEALTIIREMFQPESINLVARDESGVIGWIGGMPIYDGFVYELHPLAVRPDQQRRGVGRALVAALEAEVAARGANTLFVGTDDLLDMTTLGGVDLYPNPLNHLARIQDLTGHPYRFYERCGFVLVGILPDANGFGKPDLFMAKRVKAS
ncbi:MAG TPA: GNAT family N-acetyltransferase [Candidatus Limnocylindrales bacterium]|nr:GNAT family N-acetyltransferase [Candidatus Limnocylindrales bacterium]